jgi:hypothetical protein
MKSYIPYLKYFFSHKNARELIIELNEMKYFREVKSLELFYNNDINRENIRLNDFIWSHDSQEFVGIIPPDDPQLGWIWFDIITLTPFVFSNNLADWSEESKGWYALHPVYSWQYDAFIKFAKWNSSYPISTIDISSSTEGYITNIRQIMAMACANWFGFELASSEIENLLGSELNKYVANMFSSNLYLWEGSFYSQGFSTCKSYKDIENNFREVDYMERELKSYEYADDIGMLFFFSQARRNKRFNQLPIKLDEGNFTLKNSVMSI